MHTSRCVPASAGLRTVPLPRQQSQTGVPSGNAVPSNISSDRGYALWISVGEGGALLLLQSPGSPGVTVYVEAGSTRLLMTERYTNVLVTATTPSALWIEELAPVFSCREGGEGCGG